MWYSLALFLVCVLCGRAQLHKARQFAHAAGQEKSATLRHIYREHHVLKGLKFNYFSCDFFFRVDGVIYGGQGDCPQLTSTVYYDAADPSIHSLMEFQAASRARTRNAIPWFVLAAIFLLCLIFSAVLAVRAKCDNSAPPPVR
jgi:hypothetical protein